MNRNAAPDSIGVALIGCGDIGVLRAEAVAGTPGLHLAVVSDVDLARAAAIAQRFGARSTPCAAAVIDPAVRIVIIATPPNTHGEIALAAIAAGKDVLCEKPLAHRLEDAQQMCDAADQANVLLKTGFNHRYFPSIARARKLVASGTIGDVVFVRAHAGHPGDAEFGHAWVHDGAVTGGGALTDNGIHILDLTRFFVGEVDRATGYATNLVYPFPTAEDNAFGLYRTAGGAVAYVHASWTEWRGYRFSIEAYGTRGYVRASYPPMFLEWGVLGENGAKTRRHFDLYPMFQIKERIRGWKWTIVQSFIAELSDFVQGVRERRPVVPTGRDGLRAMQMAHAVYVSSRDGHEVAF